MYIDYVIGPLCSSHGYPMLNQETSHITITGDFTDDVLALTTFSLLNNSFFLIN